MSLAGSNDTEKLIDLASKPYKQQAVWFLNAYWKQFAEQEAERLWKFTHDHAELDQAKKGEGCALDEFQAHRFLEINQETLTVTQMRDKLREVGVEKVRLVPFIHFLIFRYKVDWHELVNAAQGDNQEEVKKAQQMLVEVQAAFEEVRRTAEEAAAREVEAKAAQKELEAALAELKAQEDAYNRKTEELKRASEEGGLVSRNKAKNELAQHLGEDPLPLRRAKITTEAAVKKAEKAANAAEEARVAAEAALQEAERRVAEAQAYLDEVKSKPGSAQGALWWLDRELHEARAYLPTSKGGYKKQK
ncbi:Signal recognition particle receptor FtsY [Balamuthia mandrillaris]